MIYRFILGLLFAGMCAAQEPAQGGLGPQKERGSVSGTVSSLAGQPLKNAIVHLQAAFTGAISPGFRPQSYATSSDDQGNFLFENLEPARYMIAAEHTGYLRAMYSANSKSAPSVLDVSSGQQLTGIAVKLSPQGVIAGRITNEDNEPFPNVQVGLTHWAYVNGRRQLQLVAGSVLADAEGGFAIGNLAAGNYYVSALAPSTPFQAELRGRQGPVASYVPTYYPGVADPSGATAIQVSAGAVVRGADIRMRQAVLYRVLGTVVDPASADPPPNMNLFMNPRDNTGLGVRGSTAAYRNGAFEFSNVLPGSYILQATNSNSLSVGRQIVTVGNGDVEGLVVQLGQSVQITGHILTESSIAMAPPGANSRVYVNVMSLDDPASGVGVPAKDDGNFKIPGISPGPYRLDVNTPPGIYVKSIHFAGQDVTHAPLEVASGSGGKLEILLSPNAAGISGVVHDPSPEADGAPAAGVTVTLWTAGIPAEGAADFTRIAITGADGQFSLPGLPPGEYRVAAWEQIDPGLATVPQFRIKFEDQATTVKVAENDHAQVQPTLILRDAIETEAAKLQ